jgi:hypothetical protein
MKAKIGQGVLRANINRMPDEIFRAVTFQGQAQSQMMPGDLGSMSPAQHSEMMMGEMESKSVAERVVDSVNDKLTRKPEQQSAGLHL